MTASSSEFQQLLSEAQQQRERLLKADFHLKSLLETSRELSSAIEPQKLLNTFLLSVMGTFSMGCGFILICDRAAKMHHHSLRGVTEKLNYSWEIADQLLFKCFNASSERQLSPMTISRIPDLGLFQEIAFPFQPETALFFVIEQRLLGLLVLGARLSDSPFSAEEGELLFTLTVTFMIQMKNAQAISIIRNLNQDLETRNRDLKNTIRELTEAKKTITALEKVRDSIRGMIRREAEHLNRASHWDLILITLFSLVIGLLYNANSPNRIPVIPQVMRIESAPKIAAVEAEKLISQNQAVLVDARPAELFQQEHIPSAINLPPALFDFIYIMKFYAIAPDTPLIVYGRNISRHYDEEVAYLLKMRAHEQVMVLHGGLKSWKNSGFEVNRETP